MENLKEKENFIVNRGKSYLAQWDVLVSFIETFVNFMAENTNLGEFVYKKNENQLELKYCGEIFLIDFSVVLKDRGRFYICAKTYKEIKERDFNNEEVKYLQEGEPLFSNGHHIYIEQEGVMKFTSDGIEEGVYNLIVETLFQSLN